MASKTMVGIDIGAHSVKAARVENKGGFTVLGLGEEPMPPNATMEQQKEAIQRALTKAGGRRSRCAIGLSRDQVVLRRIDKLPKDLDEESMQEVIRLQADSELPFDHGEAEYDYLNVRESEESVSVEIVAARRSEVERLTGTAREAGGKPVALAPSVFAIPALARLNVENGHHEHHDHDHHDHDHGEHHLLIVDVGHSATEVGVMCDGAIETTRSFPIGVDDLRGGARAPALFIGELTRTIQAHKRQFEDEHLFDAVWLWGGGAKMRFDNITEDGASVSLAQLVEAQLGAPVHTDVEIKGFKDSSLVDEAPAGWQRYGVALGLAVGGLSGTLEANLIPKMDKEKHEQADLTRQALVYVISAAAIMAAVALISAQIKRSQADNVRDLNNEIKTYRVGKAAADLEASKIRRMNSYLAPKYSVLDVMLELTELLSDRPSIAATALHFTDDGEVQIDLQARSHDVVTETARKIYASPWFDTAEISQVTTFEENRNQIHQFKITAKVSGNAAMLAVRRIGSGNVPTAREETDRRQRGGGGQRAQGGGGENRPTAARNERPERQSEPQGNAPPQPPGGTATAVAPIDKAAFEALKGADIDIDLESLVKDGALNEEALKKLKESGAAVTVIKSGSSSPVEAGSIKITTIETSVEKDK